MPSFSRNINVISRCAHTYRSDALAPLGLSACHYFYIFHVCNSPGISQDTLAKNLYINKSTVTRALATLEENGFIERRQSEVDRRITLVYPTDKATDSLPFVRESAKSWNEFLLSCLDEKERETLGEMIEKIAKKAESYVEENMSAKDIIKK